MQLSHGTIDSHRSHHGCYHIMCSHHTAVPENTVGDWGDIMSLRTEPNSSDMQWYDRAIELGAMSTEKDKWNYAAHYEYHGTFGNIHKFVDAWNGTKLWIDFYSKIF